MPWSGGAFTRTNGVHTGATLWVQDRDAGTKILAARHDTHDQDLAGGINSTLEKSGSNAATGNLNIGSNRLTAVADGTAKTDAATVNQLQGNAPAFQATDTGTANAHVIALSPAITAYAAGQAITFKSGAASTTASTVNVNGLGVKAIKKKNDQDIAAGDIESGSIVTVVYDGTNFQMTSQLASDGGLSIGGSNTQVQYNNSGALAGDADFTFDGSNVSLAKALYLADGAVATPSVTNTGDVNTGIYFPAADTVGVVTGGVEQFRFGSNSVSPGSKNLIENGGMNVSQRGSQTGQGGTNNVYSALDRWLFRAEGVGQARVNTSISEQSDANSLIMKGVRNAIEIDVTTAESSVAAGECLMLAQKLEARNLQHLLYGTSGAKDMTLSFVMKSPKAGTHCVSINQGDANRSYIAEFTMASANTFEYFSLTIPGDTSGDIDNNNGEGMRLHFPFTAGTNFHNTAGSWFNGEDYATSNQQNLLDNTSNNIYISAVQLEVGGVFTGFEFEDYGTTLAKCQRYFQRFSDLDAGMAFANGHAITTTRTRAAIMLPVRLRDETYGGFTFAFSDIAHISVRQTNTAYAASSVTTYASAAGQIVYVDLTVATMPNAGMAVNYESDTNNAYFEVSAEL